MSSESAATLVESKTEAKNDQLDLAGKYLTFKLSDEFYGKDDADYCWIEAMIHC